MDVLALDKFTFYLKQDNIFLKEFCNFLQIAKQKSNSPNWGNGFDGLISSIVNFDSKCRVRYLSRISSGTNFKDLFSGTTTTLDYVFSSIISFQIPIDRLEKRVLVCFIDIVSFETWLTNVGVIRFIFIIVNVVY